MARKPRGLGAGVYRVWVKARPQRILFRDPEDYRVYLTTLTFAKRNNPLKLYHYSLLRNEVHLLIDIPNSKALSSTLHQTHLTFSWHTRRKYHTEGRLFHDRFRHEVVNPQSLLQTGQQVECIPVRVGLTTRPEDYPYSSFAHYAFGKPNSYLDPNPCYSSLATTTYQRQEAYRKLRTATDPTPPIQRKVSKIA